MILFIIFFTILVLAFTTLALSRAQYAEHIGLKLPPGTMGWPLIGDTLIFRKPHPCTSLGDYLEDRVHRYGKIYKTNVFGWPTVVSADAELNRFVLMNDERVFVPSFPKAVEAIFGRHSMLILSGEMHKYMKSLSVNFMGIPRLREHFLGDAEGFIKQAFGEWKESTPFSAKDEASKVTFNLMVKNILSMHPGEPRTDQIRKLYTTFMKGVVALPFNLPITEHGKAMRARSTILQVIEELMEERIHKRREGKDEIGERDLLGFCLESYNLNAEQFGDLILGLLFGGHETSATGIAMSIYFLPTCPEVVKQLRVPVTAGSTARVDNYMPFGQGLRNCAGLELAKLEMAVFLHHLVLNFDWEVLEPSPPVVRAIPEFPKGLPIRVRRLSPVKLN